MRGLRWGRHYGIRMAEVGSNYDSGSGGNYVDGVNGVDGVDVFNLGLVV